MREHEKRQNRICQWYPQRAIKKRYDERAEGLNLAGRYGKNAFKGGVDKIIIYFVECPNF